MCNYCIIIRLFHIMCNYYIIIRLLASSVIILTSSLVNIIFIELSSDYMADVAKFKGMGLNFNAKLIGIQEVPAQRGENICQEVIGRLKQTVLNSGVHKQKIVINVSLEGVRIYDMKSNVCCYDFSTLDSDTFKIFCRKPFFNDF